MLLEDGVTRDEACVSKGGCHRPGMLDPFAHACQVTGHTQTALVDSWATSGVAVALSEVTGPHVYVFGRMEVPSVAITLYGVKRHVLLVDGKVRRDSPVLPGRFRIGQPGQDVVVDAIPGEALGKLLLLYLGPRLLQRVADETGRHGPVELIDRAWDVEDGFLHQMACRLVETAPQHRGADRLFADQIGLTLALHVLDRHSAVRVAPPPVTRCLAVSTVDRIIEFVRAQSEMRVSLAELAALAGLSQSHFLRQFRLATGLTPHRFVVQERILRARHLLSKTNIPASEVALSCGFSSQSHLGFAFRGIVGVTPRQFRRSCGRIK